MPMRVWELRDDFVVWFLAFWGGFFSDGIHIPATEEAWGGAAVLGG
jgi:hypothetical protein